jgi:nuclear transport factor 2 (NTF2) superfamily protein
VDVKGKVLVMMVNDPQPTAAEPNRFAGKGLTYYGRWTYKFEEAARRGAAGVLLIHTDASASYGWSVVHNSWTAERFQLADADLGTGMQGWITEATRAQTVRGRRPGPRQAARRGRRQIVQAGRAERARAGPVEGGGAHAGTVQRGRHRARHRSEAEERSRDLQRALGPPGQAGQRDNPGGDTIFNGAVDNASGSAGLLAMAQEAVRHPARRSQMFLWVAAEEQGLLGSAAYAAKPLWPLAKTAADLNLDSLNFVGARQGHRRAGQRAQHPGRDGGSQVAKAMGLKVAPARRTWPAATSAATTSASPRPACRRSRSRAARDWVKDKEANDAKAEGLPRALPPGAAGATNTIRDACWDLSAGMVQQAQLHAEPGPPIQKVRAAEDGWNTRSPEKVALAYTPDSQWRNRAEFVNGREQIVQFLDRKWKKELDYRLIKELWAFEGNRIAVRFAYEWHDDSGNWFRSFGNENWEFDDNGLMARRFACINDLPIKEADRKYHWPLGRRPDDHPSLSDLGF